MYFGETRVCVSATLSLLTRLNFFLFLKLKIRHNCKIWGCRKDYDSADSCHIQRGVSEVLRQMENSLEKECLNAEVSILTQINVLFNAHFCLGWYIFSLDTFWTRLIDTFTEIDTCILHYFENCYIPYRGTLMGMPHFS